MMNKQSGVVYLEYIIIISDLHPAWLEPVIISILGKKCACQMERNFTTFWNKDSLWSINLQSIISVAKCSYTGLHAVKSRLQSVMKFEVFFLSSNSQLLHNDRLEIRRETQQKPSLHWHAKASKIFHSKQQRTSRARMSIYITSTIEPIPKTQQILHITGQLLQIAVVLRFATLSIRPPGYLLQNSSRKHVIGSTISCNGGSHQLHHYCSFECQNWHVKRFTL